MEKDCLFCKIAAGEMDTPFEYENESVVVFKDINPHAPVHLLVVPKKHIRSINDLTPEDEKIVSELIVAGQKAAVQAGVSESGVQSFPRQSMACAGGSPSMSSHQTSPSSVSATLV